jgi:hypothetical protein
LHSILPSNQIDFELLPHLMMMTRMLNTKLRNESRKKMRRYTRSAFHSLIKRAITTPVQKRAPEESAIFRKTRPIG